jgi:GNAT superfamily N-acetyltransferase
VGVRVLDTSALSEEAMAGIYRVMSQCHAEENAEEPCRSLADAEAFLRHVPASDPRDYWVAERGVDIVGFAQLSSVHASPAGYVEILVRPDARRLGYGAALLGTVREQARARGCRVLIGNHATAAGATFAAWAGAADTRREIRSLLKLPLPDDVAIRPVRDYSLRGWVGATPAALLGSFARAREAINDAPRASEHEQAVWDEARVRELEAALERRGRDIRVTVALDRVGLVVAFTELRVSRAPGAIAGTEDTAVLAQHRRKGLARWAKVESLLRLQHDRPDVVQVATTNAEENLAMLALNRSLGFEPVAVYTSCVLDV